jgi:peptidyl-dipeptidase Dcp
MRRYLTVLLFAATVALAACTSRDAATPETAKPEAAAPAAAAPNALLAEWTGPHGGVPAFDRLDVALVKPAMEEAMAINRRELDAIAAIAEPPTFENTIVAMEKTGRDLDRTGVYFGILAGNLSSPEFRTVQAEIAPLVADHQTWIVQNRPLFERVEAVRESEAAKSLAPDEQRLLRLDYDQFARNGAALDGAARERYAAINKRLAELQTKFSNNVLADEEKYVLFLEADQLGGLPKSFLDGAATLAAARNTPGRHAVLNTRSSIDPFLTFSDRRDLREKVWRTFYSRGDNGDGSDNNALIVEILTLRHERSRLLGYPDYATWRLEDRMAGTPARAFALMESVWPAAVARVKEEVADMQKVADREGAKIRIEPWDYRYYSEKVRTERYAFDSDEVRQYLQLDKLREAMFQVAGELFGFKFTPVPDGQVAVFHPAVKVWEVTDKASGKHIGLWYLDPFARAGKRSGAWAFSYRTHASFDGERTVLSSNNSNFIEGAPGEPVLISWGDARTYFHEFGHALHALSSGVRYPTLNRGVRDYTEFQSQLLERWLLTQPVIDQWLVHAKTGEPIPAELVDKLRRADTFNTGFETAEYLASAILDLKLHTMDPAGLDPDAFERDTLKAMGMPSEVVMRHRTPHFSHVFSSEGYAAGYYGYLWADVLASDASEAFAAAPGGFYDKDLAAKLVAHLFSVSNSVDPGEAYRAFRGRDATIDALLRDRGFPVSAGGMH